MKMPDGWARLANEFSPERLAFAMQTMKEMAEVLERIKKCCDQDNNCELTGITNAVAVQYISSWIEPPLEKFKGWK